MVYIELFHLLKFQGLCVHLLQLKLRMERCVFLKTAKFSTVLPKTG